MLYTEKNDDSDRYDESSRYYSIEDSLGGFGESFSLYSFINSGYKFRMRTSRHISHISGMPESEDIYYSVLEGDEKERVLFKDGKQVITGSNIVTPQIKTYKEGECETAEEACSVINELLSRYELSKYNAVPLAWDTRHKNSFYPTSPHLCIIHSTVITGNEESGEYLIELKNSSQSTPK